MQLVDIIRSAYVGILPSNNLSKFDCIYSHPDFNQHVILVNRISNRYAVVKSDKTLDIPSDEWVYDERTKTFVANRYHRLFALPGDIIKPIRSSATVSTNKFDHDAHRDKPVLVDISGLYAHVPKGTIWDGTEWEKYTLYNHGRLENTISYEVFKKCREGLFSNLMSNLEYDQSASVGPIDELYVVDGHYLAVHSTNNKAVCLDVVTNLNINCEVSMSYAGSILKISLGTYCRLTHDHANETMMRLSPIKFDGSTHGDDTEDEPNQYKSALWEDM